MTKKEFMNRIIGGKHDVLQELLDILNTTESDYCIVGGLAVNAYVEPVVSLDLDIVVATDSINTLLEEASKSFKLEKFANSVNLSRTGSDLRIQLQTDPRYQRFIGRSSVKGVMGYKMKVAALKDVLKGKIWAYSSPERRESKRQKDLADIFRLVERYPELKKLLPEYLRKTPLP